MTRKITLSIILILLIFGCYQLLFSEQLAIRKNVASVSQLKSSSRKLETASVELEKNSTTVFEQKKAELKETIKKYNEAKSSYESIVPSNIQDANEAVIENELKDIYDVDFLWTIVGNYATEEGINLKFDINKNFTSASSINNTSSNYIVCDLKFVITGQYINLTDFIYDIEDDDRLNFEINDFKMKKTSGDATGGSDENKSSTQSELEVTLNVREVKINSDNLIETMNTSDTTSTTEENETQEINSNTTNTTNTTNTENTTNTTNTINNTVSNSVN